MLRLQNPCDEKFAVEVNAYCCSYLIPQKLIALKEEMEHYDLMQQESILTNVPAIDCLAASVSHQVAMSHRKYNIEIAINIPMIKKMIWKLKLPSM